MARTFNPEFKNKAKVITPCLRTILTSKPNIVKQFESFTGGTSIDADMTKDLDLSHPLTMLTCTPHQSFTHLNKWDSHIDPEPVGHGEHRIFSLFIVGEGNRGSYLRQSKKKVDLNENFDHLFL